MYGRSEVPQHWSVHAEFTISHDGINDPNVAPQTHTEHDENGVRMTYTWSSQTNSNVPPSTWAPPPSSSRTDTTTASDNKQQQYAFQRGNLFFTSTPPRKPESFNPNKLGVHDSGYGSDLLSPNGHIPHKTHPYNRRCRSTCSIILSTGFNDQNKCDENTAQCGRTQSLRCQTPTLRCDRKDSYYGCGDPWCYHSNYGDDLSYVGRFSPVPETCEDCPSNASTKRASRASTFHTRSSSSPPPAMSHRKDASVQTFQMVDKCTSPFMKTDSFDFKKEEKAKKKKRTAYCSRRKTEPVFQRTHSPSTITPDSLENLKAPRRLTRSPKQRTVSPFISEKKDSASDTKSSDQSKKPRTVHIDVYCTGTELESDASSSSSDTENKTVSSPQTVFESEQMRITHKRTTDGSLPRNLSNNNNNDKENEEGHRESDIDDGISTAYPSQTSSFSQMRDFGSSLSSVPNSWTTYSMSSCTVPEDYDSVANTSWKDTVSDFGSLLESRSSIAPTESLDFVPRRLSELMRNQSIDEKEVTCSQTSLQPSDSFEYANSEDRLRIRHMDEMWKDNIMDKTPKLEQKHLLQQKKLKEYLEKRLNDKNLPKWESKHSDSDDSDESEKAWTFVKDDNKKLERDVTVRRASKDEKKTENIQAQEPSNLSISSPDSASTVLKHRLSLDPTLPSPFTIVPGIYTDQRFIANKFGPVISTMKKPGHHIGPAKNPDCLCDHCQQYFENIGGRSRTRSMGDESYRVTNWKEFMRPAHGMPKDTKSAENVSTGN